MYVMYHMEPWKVVEFEHRARSSRLSGLQELRVSDYVERSAPRVMSAECKLF